VHPYFMARLLVIPVIGATILVAIRFPNSRLLEYERKLG
jgi:hypothetical protein